MSIQSIEKTFRILSLFSVQKPRWGITEIAKTLEYPVTTVSSIVRTLSNIGVLEQNTESRRYGLGMKLFNFGVIVGETLEINQMAEDPAHQLADSTGLICRVALWDYDAALVTLDITPREAEFLSRRIGPRLVAYCSSVGRVLLSHLDPPSREDYMGKTRFTAFTPYTITDRAGLERELKLTKERGYAINNQELSLDRASIAVPIFKSGGAVAAAISIVGSPQRLLESEHGRLLGLLKRSADHISWRMGHRPISVE